MILSDISSTSDVKKSVYTLLTKEERLDSVQRIRAHRWRGTPMVLLGAIALCVSLVLLLVGSLLLGYPLEGFVFAYDIFLPFLLPAILGIVGVVIPLFFFASHHHIAAMGKHKQLAESNYMQILEYCQKQQKAASKQMIADFIEAYVLLPQYTRRFSFITLSQTLRVIPESGSAQAFSHDSIISESINYVLSGIFMGKHEKEKRRKKEQEQETQSANQQTTSLGPRLVNL